MNKIIFCEVYIHVLNIPRISSTRGGVGGFVAIDKWLVAHPHGFMCVKSVHFLKGLFIFLVGELLELFSQQPEQMDYHIQVWEKLFFPRVLFATILRVPKFLCVVMLRGVICPKFVRYCSQISWVVGQECEKFDNG